MNEIKFQFIFKGKPYSSENQERPIFKKVYTLGQLLEKPLSQLAAEYSFSDLIAHRQYTGMNDCEGVEIFEGDILALNNTQKRHSYCVYEIKFNDVYGKYIAIAESDDNSCDLFDLLNYYDGAGEYVVIGNIYENPELLEQGE